MNYREFKWLWAARQASGSWSRRSLIKATFASLVASLTIRTRRSFGDATSTKPLSHLSPSAPVEYIVVGSGAGGGPLACNLARAGHKVVLFEAGGGDAEDVSAVPFFNGAASEDPRIRWDFFVRHYSGHEQQQRDSKYLSDKGGVWYPRVGSLGGCTDHSAMIEIYPSDSDWDYIANVTGDQSWNAGNMRKYFERLEQCRYVDSSEEGNPARHGFDGWQPTEIPDPRVYADDPKVLRILAVAAREVRARAFSLLKFFASRFDPNDWRIQRNREGLYNLTLFTRNGRRYGPRQLIRKTRAALPNNLIVMTHSLVTRVLFEGTTAVGVEYIRGKHLYRADPSSPDGGEPLGPTERMRASREVILSGGAFNTPQLLKLSGIGPGPELASHGITQIVDLPGVGMNLQDRYEIGVVTNVTSDFTFAEACTFGQGIDPCYAEWLEGKGPYTGYGVIGCMFHKSDTARAARRPDPDLFFLIGLTRFIGYYPGYSMNDFGDPAAKHQMTWTILKAHTHNDAGTVKLRSSDPRDTPIINFHYFDEGSDQELEDLRAMVDGVEMARRMNARLAAITNGEVFPGSQVQSREDIAQFIRDEAWSHHASCTCKMGPADDPMTVVDSRFRVHGTRNLRVVDASVFPRIPGYFILMPIYMVSEKASDVILASARLAAEALQGGRKEALGGLGIAPVGEEEVERRAIFRSRGRGTSSAP